MSASKSSEINTTSGSVCVTFKAFSTKESADFIKAPSRIVIEVALVFFSDDKLKIAMYQELLDDPASRPREKLLERGVLALSDLELLSLLLGSGNRNHSVSKLARTVLNAADKSREPLTVNQLLTIEGIGIAKAATLVAALEFSRRRIAADGVKVRTPDDVIPLVAHLNDRKQEVFVCVSLSGAHEVIATRIVTVGLANMCQVHPREVLADPIVDRACSIIVAHNHPSGDLTPSDEDLKVTSRLKSAAAILGINLLDHIVFSRRGFRSILHQS